MKRIFYVLLTFLFIGTSFAQDKVSTSNREDFVSDFSKLINSSTSEDVSDFMDDDLQPTLLESDEFPEEQFQRMAVNLNQLLIKKVDAYPHAYNYVVAFFSFVKKGDKSKALDEWQEIVDELVDYRNPRRLQEFLATSKNFLYKNIIVEGRNYMWFSYGNDFKFTNDKTPFIHFDHTTLICKTLNRGRDKRDHPYSDSLKIKDTKGKVDLAKKDWIGSGGKFTWEKVGLPSNETYATLQDYKISLRSTSFTADSVFLSTPYVERSIKGKLTDRAMLASRSGKDQLPFPQFLSYQADFKINNIVDNVDYKGGFSLQANEFIGVSSRTKQAQLTYSRKDKPFVLIKADQVRVNDVQLQTPMAQFTMFIGVNDSITHTGLDITFNRKDKTLKFVRGNNARSQAPFVDSYHKLNFYVDELVWDKSSSELILGYNLNTSDQKRTARFESFNYYDGQLYQRVQGGASVNPLAALYNYAYKYDKFNMSEGDAATALELTISQAKSKLLNLSILGFISYDTDKETVKVNAKTGHFVKARSGKEDFDNISFTSSLAPIRSEPGSSNDKNAREKQAKIRERNQKRSRIEAYGKIDLNTLEMNINAVDRITISDRKKTGIFPDENKVTVKENRNFVFTGWVNSGRWEVKINSGNYSYEENKFNILESDVALFRAVPQREEDGKQLIPIQSSITGIKGELIVDDSTNRSGLDKRYGMYPKLVSKEKTRVYYDYREIHLGAYEKDRFYFELDPFKVDSLVTFDDEKLQFPGELTSAGIFPKFKEKLKLMADYSLGFSQKVSDAGYQFYGTDAKYNNKILLSNNGLQGGGTIDFINSTSTSKGLFTFLPDSTVGNARFVNEPQTQGVEFPDAIGEDVFITFLPRKKVLKARSLKEKIQFFNKEANLSGTTTLKESGMTGNGIIELEDAKIGSENFNFTRWKTEADTSNFQLVNKYKEEGEKENPLAFKSDNVNTDIDFKGRKGVFKSNEGESVVEFPVNQYICKIDQFTWLMDNDELTLEKNDPDKIALDGGMDLVGPNFYSVHPDQDSLQFRSPKARFSLKELTIYAYETEFIEVADARIYPDSATVVIRKKARMDPLEDAKIVANYITKYHTMTNVNAQITARRAYTATGDYLYGLEDGDKQLLHLDRIGLDTSYQTVATGEAAEVDSFKLSDRFNFYGDVHVAAAEPTLTFNGATQINHSCDKFERNWMAFKTAIDPKNIQIPVSKNMKDLNGNEIAVGIRWRNATSSDSISMYPTFLSAVDNLGDPNVITASGFLQYSKDAKEFQISNKEKLINRGAKGNYISLHTESCSLNGDGKINLGMDYGPVTMDAVGVVSYTMSTGKTDLNVTLALRAPFDEKAFTEVAKKTKEIETLSDADFSSTTLEQAIMEWVDLETADKIKSDYTLKKELKRVPKAMQDAIVITGLRLTSYTKPGDPQRGLKTSTAQAAIVNMYDEPVMKYVPLKMFAQQRVNIGDRFGLMIDIPASYLYFFDYDYRKEGVMNILSSDTEFNTEIKELKSDKKKSRKFIYDITKNSAYKSQFLRVFE